MVPNTEWCNQAAKLSQGAWQDNSRHNQGHQGHVQVRWVSRGQYNTGWPLGCAVVALSVWLSVSYGALVAHNGCALDVKSIPVAKKPMSCLLFNNRDDNCFAWEERYLPTRNTLISNGYNVTCVERSSGGHGITAADVSMAAIMLAAPKTS